jgi:alkanesulfonate monooxygenase SsuD/methylene tetrahydromethanopterin reductase-like flavin-dependent oxidoreductase (luciferase family)
MDYGIQIEPQFGYDYDTILKLANKSQDIGFNSIWFSDHFMLNQESTDKVLLDPWLIMAALSRDTNDIRLGSLVFCNSYRPPALHAKMGATLDVLSDGRLEFGMGAGWKEIEYNAYGYPFPPDMIRIAQLKESLQIIKKIWTQETPSFTGNYYQINEIVSYPKPIQKPHPPIWIGSMKAKHHMLDLTAQFGDGLNIAWSYSPEESSRIFDELNQLCKNHGRKPTDVRRSIGLWVRLFKNENDEDKALKEGATNRGISVSEYKERVGGALWGTSDMVASKLKEYQSLNVSYVILMFPHMHEESYLEQFRSII